MTEQGPDFSREQLKFLAFLQAFEAPIPVDLAVSIEPLSPAALLDLVERGTQNKLIRREASGILQISKSLNRSLRAEIKIYSTPGKISSWLKRLESSKIKDGLNPVDLIPLYLKGGNEKKVSELEMALGVEAVENDQIEIAVCFYKKAFGRLSQISGDDTFESRIIRATLEYSDLCFVMGKDFNILPAFLERALKAALRLGDHRSTAIIKFHLGRVLYFADQRAHALILLSQGQKAVKELGDVDILVRSAEFLGLYYFMQGRPKKAIEHYERAIQDMESRGKTPHLNSTIIIFYGYCAVYLGQFHKAIGFLDYHWHLALEKSHFRQAATIRATLGTILSLIGRIDEGLYHLIRAEKNTEELDNKFAGYLAKGGLAYCEFFKGNTKKARDLLTGLFAEGKKDGLVHQYASPFVIEMLSEFKRVGYVDIPGMPFQKEVQRLLKDPNIHLRGVVLRLRARLALDSGGDKKKIEGDLLASEAYLKRSEDPVQLAMTWLEMARLQLNENRQEAASLLTKKARLGLAGFGYDFFPDDLRHLLEDSAQISPKISVARDEFINRFLDMIGELFPTTSEEDILFNTVSATNRLFQAERGGIFRIKEGKRQWTPELQAACNLSSREVNSAEFALSLEIIRKVIRSGKPIIVRAPDSQLTGHRLKAVLCLPIEVNGRIVGVLYHDNSYLDDCFDFLDPPLIQKLIYQMTIYSQRIQGFSQQLKQTKAVAVEPMDSKESKRAKFLARSPSMIQLLSLSDQIANADTSVLISGETGVGKELLAKRIHLASNRSKGPFVVVDMTTIPETLVESELFGHEKGAFTGADHQIRGRFELADGGTLFIDEIGEAKAHVQTRLLRAIQEKKFYRVGGTREIKSDFRLLAATNRELASDVEKGLFRKDLFYRLNIMPITVPPLRERKEDIPMLAGHFLEKFADEYHYAKRDLSTDDKKQLMDYSWPGNVRELKNVMERAVVMSNTGAFNFTLPSSRDSESRDVIKISDQLPFDELQRKYFQIVLEKTGGKVSGKGGAAQWVGMNRSTLRARLKKLGVR